MSDLSSSSRGMQPTGNYEKCECGREAEIVNFLLSESDYMDCDNCGFHIRSHGKRVENQYCEFCDEPVFASEEFFEKGEESDEDVSQCDCGRWAHAACLSEKYHNCFGDVIYSCCKCEPNDDYIKCNHCGLLHNPDCIISFSKDFTECFGFICEECFYGEEFEYFGIAIDDLKEKQKSYYKNAAVNPDLTILCTHLIKEDTDEACLVTLKKILKEGRLIAAPTGYYVHTTSPKSVCFSELSLRGLTQHALRYSHFGLAFLKGWIEERGGGPALYVREDLLKHERLPIAIQPFVNKISLGNWDFHHEREWRVPGDVEFRHADVHVIYAPYKYHDELRESFPDLRILLDLSILNLL